MSKAMEQSQVKYHVNVMFAAVEEGLVSKSHDFLRGPLLVPRQNGQGSGLVAVHFGLGLVPGAEFSL